MSTEAIGWIIAAVILIGVIVFLFKGMIQTFRRNWAVSPNAEASAQPACAAYLNAINWSRTGLL